MGPLPDPGAFPKLKEALPRREALPPKDQEALLPKGMSWSFYRPLQRDTLSKLWMEKEALLERPWMGKEALTGRPWMEKEALPKRPWMEKEALPEREALPPKGMSWSFYHPLRRDTLSKLWMEKEALPGRPWMEKEALPKREALPSKGMSWSFYHPLRRDTLFKLWMKKEALPGRLWMEKEALPKGFLLGRLLLYLPGRFGLVYSDKTVGLDPEQQFPAHEPGAQPKSGEIAHFDIVPQNV
ncbi:hypothetical protein FN846DRAFT_895743 [Sphaerosporella brunnea]|uniref:Uncharacterized protein n=1 Tax=Sphaerosporella brunnea TaxID=1250544 RepID=A0A5J5EEQ6_9PEZI|nr:hypothetical protein FN846DRAFT_895743 [Sphaerosporella brunnea]